VKKWELHEKHVTKKVKGRRTVASGAVSFDKADVRTKAFRIECKQTEKKQYILKLETLLKIRQEARIQGQQPALALDICGEKFYILEEHLAERLFE
jgi:Holliday junction resolvase